MKKFLGLDDSDDDPFGKDKIQESTDDKEILDNDNDDDDDEILDIEPLPITTWRRFFPRR